MPADPWRCGACGSLGILPWGGQQHVKYSLWRKTKMTYGATTVRTHPSGTREQLMAIRSSRGGKTERRRR